MAKKINKERIQYLNEYKMNNNKESFDSLVLSYLNNIEKIIKKYEGCGLEHDELISISVEAVIHCINNVSYKNLYVLTSVINLYINETIEREIKKLNADLSYEEFSKQHNNGQEDYYYIEDEFERIINSTTLFEMLKVLTDEQRKILILRYGLFNNEELSEEELANCFNISRQGINFQKQEAINRIRRNKTLINKLKN